jgi:L-lactate dehydrogenase complex protein LldG
MNSSSAANGTPARDAILSRIRAALADVPASETPDDVAIRRDYRTEDPSPRAHRLELFVERVTEYKAAVRRVAPEALPAAIELACSARGVKRLAVPADLPGDWIPPGVEVLRDPGLSIAQVDGCDAVLTGCAVGIAQTGTVVLDGGLAQGRRVLSLVPDYHLCVVLAGQVVGLVPEAVARLSASASAPGRPITFISGPSATSDIELNRVEGVHGPRTLEVILVET